MTPQLFYNTGIDQLLDEQLNNLKNMKEDIDLNLGDALSAKQGKQVWPLNQTDSERKRKTNGCLLTYKEGRERKKISQKLTRASPPTVRTMRSLQQQSLPLKIVFGSYNSGPKVESKLLPAKEGKIKDLFFTNPEVRIHLSKIFAANLWPPNWWAKNH